MSGIVCSEEVKAAFAGMKEKKDKKLFVCKISDDNKEIVEDTDLGQKWLQYAGENEGSDTSELLMEFLSRELPKNECRYLFMDVAVKKEGLTNNDKIVNIAWYCMALLYCN